MTGVEAAQRCEETPEPVEVAPVLRLEGLSVRFLLGLKGQRGIVRAVTDVDLALRPGRVMVLVGESGCGKSVLASALLGLLPANAQVRGRAVLALAGHPERDLLVASERELAGQVRGRAVALVPQSAASHLTPVRTAGDQLAEVVQTLRPGADVRAVSAELLDRVGLPQQALRCYPHELSGGMAQRVAVALALVGDPAVVLADEPTTGLDRPLVDRTVDLLARLAREDDRAVLMITHDLRAARRIATDVAVMYASRLVEVGPADAVFGGPWHPYTVGLLGAVPGGGFRPIPGHPPELTALPPGCGFRPRCQLLGAVAGEAERDGAGDAAGDAEGWCSGDPALVRYGERLVACRRRGVREPAC